MSVNLSVSRARGVDFPQKSPVPSSLATPVPSLLSILERNHWAVPQWTQGKEEQDGAGGKVAGMGTGDGRTTHSLQQDHVGQHTEHLVEPRGLVDAPDDGTGQVCDGVLGGGARGRVVVALLQQPGGRHALKMARVGGWQAALKV